MNLFKILKKIINNKKLDNFKIIVTGHNSVGLGKNHKTEGFNINIKEK